MASCSAARLAGTLQRSRLHRPAALQDGCRVGEEARRIDDHVKGGCMMTTPTADPRIAGTIAELTAGATDREEVRTADAKSGSRFERLEIGGERYFLKTLSYERDWIMRVTGDRDYRPFLVWRHGVMAGVPAEIDHAVAGMALEGSGPSAELGILMHDVGELLVPPGDDLLDPAQHLRFVDHLAAMCAAYRDRRDDIGLTTMPQRLRFFAPGNISGELARRDPDPVLRYADQGWARLAERAPGAAALLRAVHERPEALTRALAATPATFLHGDWKLGNLGSHPDGRTILLDWAYPGEGPPCWDLAWYIALNRARMPISKEDTVTVFRDALRSRGVDVAGWFEPQLRLCLLGMAATIGWEKALGDDDELAWWVEQAERGAGLLTSRVGAW
jgi:hypothetical protein